MQNSAADHREERGYTKNSSERDNFGAWTTRRLLYTDQREGRKNPRERDNEERHLPAVALANGPASSLSERAPEQHARGEN